MAAQILEGRFDALSLAGGYVVVHRSEYYIISESSAHVYLAHLCPVLVLGWGQGHGWVRVRVRLRG